MIPAERCLLRDRRTRGAIREAYLYVFEDLDLREFRPVKVLVVQHGLGISRRRAIDALHALVALGYLEKGPPDDSGVNTYRLVWACPVGSQTAPPRAS